MTDHFQERPGWHNSVCARHGLRPCGNLIDPARLRDTPRAKSDTERSSSRPAGGTAAGCCVYWGRLKPKIHCISCTSHVNGGKKKNTNRAVATQPRLRVWMKRLTYSLSTGCQRSSGIQLDKHAENPWKITPGFVHSAGNGSMMY